MLRHQGQNYNFGRPGHALSVANTFLQLSTSLSSFATFSTALAIFDNRVFARSFAAPVGPIPNVTTDQSPPPSEALISLSCSSSLSYDLISDSALAMVALSYSICDEAANMGSATSLWKAYRKTGLPGRILDGRPRGWNGSDGG
jgi:hypothetical protein